MQILNIRHIYSNLEENAGQSTFTGLLFPKTPSSDVQAHDFRFRKFLPEGDVFNLSELTKVVRLGQPLEVSFHPAFEEVRNSRLVDCFKEFESHTFQWRSSDPSSPNKLFLSFVTAHKPVSTNTVSRWACSGLSASRTDTSAFSVPLRSWYIYIYCIPERSYLVTNSSDG